MGFSYQQYLDAHNSNYAADDTGNMPTEMSESDFNALSPNEQAAYVRIAGGMLGPEHDADADIASRFRQQFGDTPQDWNGLEINNQSRTGLAVGYGDPRYGQAGWDQVARDPSRIMWLDPEGTENRRYVYERENMKPDAIIGEQDRESNSGLSDAQWAALALAMFGGAYALGEGLIGGAAADSVAAAPEALGGAGGVTEYGASQGLLNTVPEAVGATEATAATPWVGETGAQLMPNVTPLDPLTPMDGLVESAGATTSAPAFSNPPVDPAYPGTGNPAQYGFNPNSPLSIPGWDSLSAGTQRMILQGLSTGTSAAVYTRNAQRAQEAASRRAQEDRDWQTSERQRRGQVRDYTQGQAAQWRPLQGGLIASRMGGGL